MVRSKVSTITEALKVLRPAPPPGAAPFEVLLACGFTPLHLATFLAASLRIRLPDRNICMSTGSFGDLPRSLEAAASTAKPIHAALTILEWADLDPRLDLRRLGGWGARLQADIVEGVRSRLAWIRQELLRLADRCPVVIFLPTLPLPTFSCVPSWESSPAEIDLRSILYQFAAEVTGHSSIRLANEAFLASVSPIADRLDFASNLNAGFPYTVSHAAAVADTAAVMILAPPPKKGLITDLDDTLWSGLVGEIGANEIAWDLSRKAQLHGLYQQLLGSLAEQGVLLAASSKNDPANVEEAFQRSDIVLQRDHLFPMEVHWKPKSDSVRNILSAWNIGADAVVFIDDNPMEIAEVKAAHPEIECLLFPKTDLASGAEFLIRLRDLFGKRTASAEDSIRARSIRSGARFLKDASEVTDLNVFLAQSEPRIKLRITRSSAIARSFELVNKTNQFNLNGVRYSEGEWRAALNEESSFLAAVDYADKYGPLGEVGVILGAVKGKDIFVKSWVLSCRAFSRRIEHKCLDILFQHFAADKMVMEYAPTPKNGPITEFLRDLIGSTPVGRVCIRREAFLASCPPLHHATELITDPGDMA